MSDKLVAFRKTLSSEDLETTDTFLAKFGLGPKYIPQEPTKHLCPKCGKNTAYYKEEHPDTDMNEMVLYCPECKYESES